MTLRVQRKQCESCIYRNDSALDIRELERQIADPRMPGHFRGSRLCHHAPSRPRAKQVACAGFWARHKDDFDAGQLAQRLKLVEFVDVDVLGPRRQRTGRDTHQTATAAATTGKTKRIIASSPSGARRGRPRKST